MDVQLEDWEGKILDEEHQPELYDAIQVLDLKRKINLLAKVSVIVYIVVGFLPRRMILFGLENADWEKLISLDSIIYLLGTLLRIALIYFPLKALEHILMVLVQMEFNSRKKLSR